MEKRCGATRRVRGENGKGKDEDIEGQKETRRQKGRAGLDYHGKGLEPAGISPPCPGPHAGDGRQASGEETYLEREDLERFRYGALIYVKEPGIMAELEREDRERKFKIPTRMVLKKHQQTTGCLVKY